MWSQPSQTYKMLVVDDEEDFHLFIHTALKEYPVEIKGVYTGREALKQIQEERYDLILLDIMMPEGTGGDFMRVVHTQMLSVPPIVVMSSMNDARLVQNVLSTGAVAFILKPIDAVELRDTVRKILNC
ncbi:MAG: response regulator [Chloroherpetonaceae bacterium]|nr:response regulator [Chloroherpetonaceae bacterium]MDW8019469.1 response regulator [Chloroherpetonaceae bacterium]MDW8464703.1 response regulator [Chloroherpetonaceae bacterium]